MHAKLLCGSLCPSQLPCCTERAAVPLSNLETSAALTLVSEELLPARMSAVLVLPDTPTSHLDPGDALELMIPSTRAAPCAKRCAAITALTLLYCNFLCAALPLRTCCKGRPTVAC